MKFQGLKGKWSYKYVSGFMRVFDKHGNNVLDTPFEDVNLANALLISKAPEMLEMLQNVFTLLNPVTDDNGVTEAYYQLMPKIETLLKEATEI